jgi:hypothetical protein
MMLTEGEKQRSGMPGYEQLDAYYSVQSPRITG